MRLQKRMKKVIVMVTKTERKRFLSIFVTTRQNMWTWDCQAERCGLKTMKRLMECLYIFHLERLRIIFFLQKNNGMN